MPPISRAELAFFLLHVLVPLPLVRSSVYITHPYQGITCSGGSECTVTWADDGLTPLLADVGPSDFALYQGTNTLVQQIAAGVDVSQSRQLTFIPNPKAGPNLNSYWIMLTSLSARDPNNTSQAYVSYSGFFTLDNMSGVEGSPVASLTSSAPSISQAQTQPTSSVTNGVVGSTTLSGIVPTGPASSLSSVLSALSAISSAASGSSSRLLATSTGAASSPTRSGDASGTSTGSSAVSRGGFSRSLGDNSRLMNSFKLGVALLLVVLATLTSARFL